jgi:hypothetical protein
MAIIMSMAMIMPGAAMGREMAIFWVLRYFE